MKKDIEEKIEVKNEEFTRECPECFMSITYKNKVSHKIATRKNSLCKKCSGINKIDNNKVILLTKEWLYEQYCVNGYSSSKIAEIVGCKSRNKILKKLKFFKIPIRTKSENSTGERNNFFGKTHTDKTKKIIAEKKTKKILTKEWLIEQYYINEYSISYIAEISGYKNGNSITKKIKEFGLTIKPKSEINLTIKKCEEILTKDLLIDLYLTQKKSSNDIAEIVGFSNVTILSYLDKYNIKKRSKSEAKIGELNPNFGITGSQNPLFGRIKSDEEIKKLKESLPRGPDHFRWKSPEDRIEPINIQIRNCQKAKDWKKSILSRDKYTCQNCSKTSKQTKIIVDHIVPLAFLKKKHGITSLEEAINCKELWNTNNGRVLCEDCHLKTDTWGIKASYYKEEK